MSFTYLSFQIPMDGYGYASIKIAEALAKVVPDARSIDMRMKKGKFPFGKFGRRKWKVSGRAIAMTIPEWWLDIEAERLIGYTMHESSLMPQNRVDIINEKAAACLVPCQWCKESFEAQGVKAPIEVALWGIDPDDFHYLDRNDHAGPYTFLWSGTPDMRKGWDLAYRAFYAAFGGNEDARLILHFRENPRGVKGCQDKNVKILSGLLRLEDWRELLRQCDCFVFPSRGEGWGLPPREAAATGLPAIATNWSGLTEEINDWAIPLRVKALAPASYYVWERGEVGEWAEPDFDHLVEEMRWCFNQREKAATAGWIASHFLTGKTWERTALAIASAMERYG